MDENAVVPSHQGGIFIKATRLSTPVTSNPAPAPAATRPTPAPMQRADSATKTSPVSAAPPVPPKPVKHTPAPAPKQEEKLLSFHDEPSPIIPAAVPAPAPAPTPSFAAPQTQSSPFFEDDLLGFSSVPSTNSTTTSQVNFLHYFYRFSYAFVVLFPSLHLRMIPSDRLLYCPRKHPLQKPVEAIQCMVDMVNLLPPRELAMPSRA
jgi:hypothetical protein